MKRNCCYQLSENSFIGGVKTTIFAGRFNIIPPTQSYQSISSLLQRQRNWKELELALDFSEFIASCPSSIKMLLVMSILHIVAVFICFLAGKYLTSLVLWLSFCQIFSGLSMLSFLFYLNSWVKQTKCYVYFTC